MSFAQVCLALVNRVERALMLGGMGKLTVPPENCGSGKPTTPWERMQAAALR